MWTDATRRQFLGRAGLGFGALAAGAFGAPAKAGAAKSVIFLFMHGGPSHIDTFDPKPELEKLHGKIVPESFGEVQLQFSKFRESPVLASKRKFARHGQAGIEISDLFPELARHADKLAVIRSCNHDGFTHTMALNWLNNGWPRLGRPSFGSWVVYGMGSENQNLPGFVVMLDGGIKSGPPVYGAGFLPAKFQGTVLRNGPSPILNVHPPKDRPAEEQQRMQEMLRWYNERHLSERTEDSDLAARMASYELAFRMQVAAPELSDLSKETEATRRLYGMDDEKTADFAGKCLMARRLVERGVRFVQIWSGSTTGGGDWDGHAQCDKNHTQMAAKTDRPIAGLLADLESRGLLDSTLVFWGGEFGRTPTSDGSLNGGGDTFGRDHNPYGFTVWMAGGGVRGGKVIGATDEIGLRAIQDPVHVHDLHATMLGMLGIEHEKLTYPFQGRNFRLTDVAGKTELMAKLKA